MMRWTLDDMAEGNSICSVPNAVPVAVMCARHRLLAGERKGKNRERWGWHRCSRGSQVSTVPLNESICDNISPFISCWTFSACLDVLTAHSHLLFVPVQDWRPWIIITQTHFVIGVLSLSYPDYDTTCVAGSQEKINGMPYTGEE